MEEASATVSPVKVQPFDFIRKIEPAHLFLFIQSEHPQTIALILTYLEPSKASVILENLSSDMQSEVSRRIATMDRISPKILHGVETVLKKKFSTLSDEGYSITGGVESLMKIIGHVDKTTGKNIVETLKKKNPELAATLKKRIFVFEDIVMLDDRSIQLVMRMVDTQELGHALKSVDPVVQEKIFKNMTKRAATMLKEDMEYMGPMRSQDVEESQQKIISIIRFLNDTGQLVFTHADDSMENING